MVSNGSNIPGPSRDPLSGTRPQLRPGIGDAPRIPGLPPRRAGGRPGRDPTDLRSAFDRLAMLLDRDGEFGPRAGVQQRGFYLDILV